MFEVTKEFNFCAAHFLPGHEKCGKMHGHNYRVLVTFRAHELREGQMVVDFNEIKRAVGPIIDDLDHICLNEHIAFGDWPTTAEEIAGYIFRRIKKYAEVACLYSVTVFETPTSSATYRED